MPRAGSAFLLSMLYALALFQRAAFSSVSPALRSEFSLSPSDLGNLSEVFFWAYLIAIIPSGMLVDKYGPRRVSVVGALMASVGCSVFAAGASFAFLATSRMLIAVGCGVAFLCMMRFIMTHYVDRKATFAGRGLLLGALGVMVSGAPLAWALTRLSWRDMWLVLAVISALIGFLVWRILPEEPRRRGGQMARDGAPKLPLQALFAVLQSPSTYLGIAIVAGLSGSFYAFANYVGTQLLAGAGYSRAVVGWEISILLTGYGIGCAFLGWIGDRRGMRTKALMLAIICAILGWGVMLAIVNISPVWAALVFFAVGVASGATPLIYALVADQHPRAHAGLAIAAVTCGIPLGSTLAQMAATRLHGMAAIEPIVAGCAIALLGAWQLLRYARVREVRRFAAA